MLHGQADIIEAVEQTMLAEGLHFKRINRAVRGGDGLLFKINAQVETSRAGFGLEQRIDNGGVQANRQQAVLEAVIEEDVGIAGGDDDAESVVFQCPRRMFARRAAAEVFARQQDLRTLVAGWFSTKSGLILRLLLSMPGSP